MHSAISLLQQTTSEALCFSSVRPQEEYDIRLQFPVVKQLDKVLSILEEISKAKLILGQTKAHLIT